MSTGRLLSALLALGITLPLTAPIVVTTQGTTASPTARAEEARILAYRELTALAVSPNSGGEQAPLLSDDGQRVAFAVAPGTKDPATPNRIIRMNADGAAQEGVDSYPSLCFCGSAIDLSADGGSVVSTDAVQLRISDSAGRGRALITLASNEINAARISGDGAKVFFRVYRDTAVRDSGDPIERGVWVIDADGSGLRQIVGPRQLEALGLPPTDFVGSNSWTLDTSTDGSRLVFAAYHDPKEAGEGEGLFAVNMDGSGLRELVGRVSYILNAALSGDGRTVAYSASDLAAGTQEVGVLPFDGGTPSVLVDGTQRLPMAAGWVPGSDDRMQLSLDGSALLLGSSGVMADTASGDLRALGVTVPGIVSPAPLVGNGLSRATMDASAHRILYLAPDPAGVLQLARLDLDRTRAEEALALTDAAVTPTTIQNQEGSVATVRARVDATDALVGLGAAVLLDGLPDNDTPAVALLDDGSHGDGAAEDGLFANDGLSTSCCAVAGPRVVRVQAEAVGDDGRRVATAVDLPGFTVEIPGPTATPEG